MKKKNKNKKKTPELGTQTSTVFTLLLPIKNFCPREIPSPTLLCARTKTTKNQKKREKNESVKTKKKKKESNRMS